MALPFACFFLCLLFLLPNFHVSYGHPDLPPSSPNTAPRPCPGTCGGIQISPPFFLHNTENPSSINSTSHHTCIGKYSIICDLVSDKAMIQFADRELVVKNISYNEEILILLDLELSGYLHQQQQCGFLYNFTDHIRNFTIPPRIPKINFLNSPIDCGNQTDAFSHAFFPTIINSHHCNDYNLYYWDESESSHQPRPAHSANCSVAQTSFQWVLSFGIYDDPLSLLSAGFSRWFELQEDCLYCQVTGKSCASSSAATNSTCLCQNVCKPKGLETSRKKTMIMIGIGTGVGFILVCLSLALYFRKPIMISSISFCKKDLNKNQNIEAFLEEYCALAPKRYSYSDVKKITKSFQEKLGQGGYGTVFKGTLSNGHAVAVKILNDSKGDGEEFINEVASIGRTSHINVVSLLGFCFEGSKRALIYDFMCNGSLEKLLHIEEPKTTLDWEQLYQIAIGIARGLEYLHRGCITRIVHFDIKPHNILLDQDFCPKISDFGLAKLCLKKDSIISIAGARGTIGYIAPEVFSRNFGVVSSKSDVYSYGMMILEIAGGKKNANAGADNSSEAYFPHWIYEHLEQNDDLLAYGVSAESEETVRKMILVGLWCIQTMPQNRPPMSRVIEMLEGSVNDLQVPPKPYVSSSPFGSLIGSSSIQDIYWFPDEQST